MPSIIQELIAQGYEGDEIIKILEERRPARRKELKEKRKPLLKTRKKGAKQIAEELITGYVKEHDHWPVHWWDVGDFEVETDFGLSKDRVITQLDKLIKAKLIEVFDRVGWPDELQGTSEEVQTEPSLDT